MAARRSFVLFCALCFGFPSTGFGQFAELSSKVPTGANAIVAMDVAALAHTPLAQEQGWTQKLQAAYASRAVFLPPEAERLLMASQVLPNADFQQNWEVAVMTLTEPLSLQTVARAEGGYLDQIDGKDVVWTPSDAYFVALNDNMLGILAPAQRQTVARWIEESAKNRGDTLSSYLQLSLGKVTDKTQIVLAIDLNNVVTPHRVEDRLKQSETLAKSSLKLSDTVALIQSLQGATIEVSVGDTARARARIDFGLPVKMTDVIAKRLVLEALEHLGMELADIGNYRFSTLSRSILAEGELSPTGLRRLLSVIDIPTTKFSELKEETEDTQTPSAGDMAENSQVYFKSVVALLDDLRGDRQKQDTRGGMDGLWMERYARKIDRLPILHVDEDLLAWGSQTAETLRQMATARRGAGLSIGVQQSALRTGAYTGGYSNYSYGYGGAGYVGVSSATSNEKDRNQIKRTAQNRATATKVEGWRLIEGATADIRRTMTHRYGVEF